MPRISCEGSSAEAVAVVGPPRATETNGSRATESCGSVAMERRSGATSISTSESGRSRSDILGETAMLFDQEGISAETDLVHNDPPKKVKGSVRSAMNACLHLQREKPPRGSPSPEITANRRRCLQKLKGTPRCLKLLPDDAAVEVTMIAAARGKEVVEAMLGQILSAADLPEEYWRTASEKIIADDRMTRKQSCEQWVRREYFIQYFAWAVPSLEALLLITQFAQGRPILEVGAGSGLWSALLVGLGAKVVATDKHPRDQTFCTVHECDATTAVSCFPTCKTLLLVWPLGQHHSDSAMSDMALEAFRGKRVVYVGESFGGCTASDQFFEMLKVPELGWRERRVISDDDSKAALAAASQTVDEIGKCQKRRTNWKLVGAVRIPAWWACQDECWFLERQE